MNTLSTLKPGQRLQTKALDSGDPILAAVAEHAKKFEAASAASALEIKALATANGELKQDYDGLVLEIAAIKSKGMYASQGTGNAQPSPVSLFLKSNQLQAMKDGAPGTGRVSLKGGGLELLTKSITNLGLGGVGDNAYSVQPERLAGLGNFPKRPLRLLDVLPKLAVSTGSVEYVQLNGYANAAAVQAVEGTVKANATIPTQVVTAYAATIAHYVRASLQVMDDFAALGTQMEMLLSYGVQDKLEQQLVNGPGGVGQIKGLYTQATPFAATATDPQDRIGEAVTSLLSIGWIPSAILLNPIDWGTILRTRGTTNDIYLLGSPRDPAPPSLWSVPVVLSASMPVGEALVMDTAQMSLLDRQEVVMAASREEGTNFISNMVTLLAELRAGLAVYSPSAVVSLSLVHS
jgi:HK97 family phage major capsid protein